MNQHHIDITNKSINLSHTKPLPTTNTKSNTPETNGIKSNNKTRTAPESNDQNVVTNAIALFISKIFDKREKFHKELAKSKKLTKISENSSPQNNESRRIVLVLDPSITPNIVTAAVH